MSERHPLVRLEALVLIAIGGFAGSNLRYFIDLLAPGLGGTLVVNTLGCFALGFLVYEMQYSGILTEQTRLTAGTGFLSSFTTYSTFALESILSGSGIVLIGYVALTYGLGFGGVVAGRTLARRIDDGVSNG